MKKIKCLAYDDRIFSDAKQKMNSSSSSASKAVFPLDDAPPSYFVTIKIPAQPKIRIRIPTLLSKSIHRRRSDSDDNVPDPARPGRLGKLGTVFSNAMKKAGFGLETAARESRAVVGWRGRGERFVRVSKSVLRSRVSKIRAKKVKVNLRVSDLLKRSRAAEDQKKPGLELCKKRILMGGKCKPLSITGSLHYDKNGVLLPEEFA